MITYKIIREANLILIRNQGDTPIEECIALMKQLRMDPGYSHEYDVLNDNRGLNAFYTHDEIQTIVDIKREFDQDLPSIPKKNAIVVDRALLFGISREYGTLSQINDDPLTTMVFYSIGKALEWLERNPDIIL